VLLAVFAVAVFAAAVFVVKQGNPPLPGANAVGQIQPNLTPTATPGVTASAIASASSITPRALLLLGPDLARLGPDVAEATGDTVEVSSSLLTPDADFARTPDTVVLQILAGTKTSVRTAEAIKDVRSRWASADIFVVGPFSSADRKSAAAVKSAAAEADVPFLDPVDLDWRDDPAPAKVASADIATVATKLAAALP